jgi:Holliday junction DNA helicase RuvA
MISYLSGKIIFKKDKFVILEVNNIGYKVFISKKALLGLKEGEDIKMFSYLNVKENGLELYGFLTNEEFELFEILEQIRGIGPKAALEISSIGPLEKIKDRILKHDEGIFEGIPGIGKKKAMAIIMELSGKIMAFSKIEEKSHSDDAENGLVSLGFSRQDARTALKEVPKEITDAKVRIKEALKILGR